MLFDRLSTFNIISFKYHLLISLFIRIIFIVYGLYQDSVSNVQYTDVDYKVFTDASRHILNNKSPYERHTYRYTPLLALLLTPNLFLHHTFGKLLFSMFDILVAIIIQKIIINNLFEYEYMKRSEIYKIKQLSIHKMKCENTYKNSKFVLKANICAMLWLYNPLAITISTRGNCDSISTFLVLLTLYFLQNKKMYFVSGLIHGLSIYLRLYPLIYSLSMYVFLSDLSSYLLNYNKRNESNADKRNGEMDTKSFFYFFLPNFNQMKLIVGVIVSLFSLIGISYLLYGYKFLYETYLYHIIRKDIRHNFSLYFYLQYLATKITYQNFWLKILMVLPQLILLVTFSVKYSLNKFCLNFSILSQTIVFVIFNSVLTSQYFVWIMGLLPLCVLQIKMPIKTVSALILLWAIAQLMWLLPAYYLEFRGKNTFFLIWIQCVSFYCANVAILGRLLKYYMIS